MKPLVSVIINNYNYDRFLRQAIQSAIDQTYARLEVLVVDDGSTDNSRQIIASFGNRIIPVLKVNGGQASAFNVGFQLCHGDIVLFLDSDDFLAPDAIERVVFAWTPKCGKVQFRLAYVDEGGQPIGFYCPGPKQKLPMGDILPLALQGHDYPSPPSSGNAYARGLLQSVLPVPEAEYRVDADAYLIAIAPFYGDITSISDVLGFYRIHGHNVSRSAYRDAKMFRDRFRRALMRGALVCAEARKKGIEIPTDLCLGQPSVFLARLTSLKWDPERHPVPGDRALRLGWKGALVVWQQYNGMRRIAWLVWFLLLPLLPGRLVAATSFWFYAPETRPALLNYLFPNPG